MNLPDDATGWLRALVRIPSVNPEGDPGTPHVGEQACAEYLASALSTLGADARLDEVLPGRPNVVARFPTDRPGKPKLLLAPHTDTVSVKGMSIDPFGGELWKGRIWGRGTTDTKGTAAAMLQALREIGDGVARLGHEVWFAGLMGEEAGQHGSKHLAARFRPDFVVAGEPTNLDVVHAHKGCTWMRVTTQGRAAHASTPERGINAIYAMTHLIEALRDLLEKDWQGVEDSVLGRPTFSVGTISGGSKTNIVPDRCTIEVDLRTVPAQDTAAIEDRLRTALTSLASDVEVQFSHAAALHTPPDYPLIARLAAAGTGRVVGAPWFCDAAIFGAAGVPAVAAGPGSITHAHTRDESLAVSDLEAGVRFYRRFLESL